MYFQMRQDFPKNPLNGTGDLSHSLKLPLRKCSCVKQGCLPWDRDVYPILDWAFPFDCSTDLQVFCGQCTFWAACLSECLLIYFLCRRVVLSNSRFYCIALSSLGSVWGDLDHPLWWLQWFCISRVSFPCLLSCECSGFSPACSGLCRHASLKWTMNKLQWHPLQLECTWPRCMFTLNCGVL